MTFTEEDFSEAPKFTEADFEEQPFDPSSTPDMANLRGIMAGFKPTKEEPSFQPGPTGLKAVWQDIRSSEPVTRLIGPQVPVPTELSPAADDIQRRGLVPALAGIPAKIGAELGRAGKAAIGDVASLARGNQPPEGDFSGNIKQLLSDKASNTQQPLLPVERAMEMAAQEDRDRNEFGVSTLAADISLGLADMAPKILMLEAAPGGLLAKSGAAAGIFGFDDKGEFQPKHAAFAAAFPFVTQAASKVADKAISTAVERGMSWVGNPTAQKAIHVAANQAAMDGLMAVQDAPELIHLASSDPMEFKRQLAKIIGSNLAFALPEIGRKFDARITPATERANTEALKGTMPPGFIPKESLISPDATTAEPVTRTATPGQSTTQEARIDAAPKSETKAPATFTAKDFEEATFPDGTVDPINTALNRLRQESTVTQPVEPAESSPGVKKPADSDTLPAAAGASPADVTDLAKAVAEIKAALQVNNPFKTQENNLESSANAPQTELVGSPIESGSGLSQENVQKPALRMDKGSLEKSAKSDPASASISETPLKMADDSGIVSGSKAEKWADDVLRGGATHAGPDVIAAYAIKGIAIIERGAVKFADWSKEMLDQFGEEIRPHLETVWKKAQRQIQQRMTFTERADQVLGRLKRRTLAYQGGYADDFSKSNRANQAEDNGRYPLSRVAEILKVPLGFLKEHGPEPTEWHHTSKFYNATSYYDLAEVARWLDSKEAVGREANPSDLLAEWLANKKSRESGAPDVLKGVRVKVLEWSGTKNYRRAKEVIYDNATITRKAGQQMVSVVGKGFDFKKALDTNGFEIASNEGSFNGAKWYFNHAVYKIKNSLPYEGLPDGYTLRRLPYLSDDESATRYYVQNEKGIAAYPASEIAAETPRNAVLKFEAKRGGWTQAMESAETKALRDEYDLLQLRIQSIFKWRDENAPDRYDKDVYDRADAQIRALNEQHPDLGKRLVESAENDMLTFGAEKANAAPIAESGAAGIKTQLESRGTGTESEASSGRTSRLDGQLNDANQSSISPAPERDKAVVRIESRMVNQADKSNMSALRPEEGSALTGETKPESENPVKPGNKFENWLNKAIVRTDLNSGDVMEGVTSAPVWLTKSAANGVLRVVRAAYRATKNVAQAIQAGLEWLQEQKLDGFKESEARAWLDKLANEERQQPAERERSAEEVKTEFSKAETDLKQATRELAMAKDQRGGKSNAEAKQSAALAAARYRTLRDELLHHPEYVAEQIAKLHENVTEANKILKPHGMAVRPDEPADLGRLHELLTPEEFKRFQELQSEIEAAHGEIQRMPKKMVARVQGEMESDGRLPEPKPMAPNAGRSLDNVTDWLRANGVDSPKLSLVDRLNLGRRFAEMAENTKTSIQKAKMQADAVWKAALESYKSPPNDSDFRHVIKSWIYADQRTGLATHQFVKELVSKVPSSLRRKAMSVWLDADGDTSLLRFQADSVPDAYRDVWKSAMKLTDGEKQLAMKIKQDFADKLDDGIKVGIIEKGREDYGVPQRWKIKPEVGSDQQAGKDGRKGTPGRINAKLDPRSPFFSFQRETPSYFDGVMAKGVPENLDIAHLVATYDAAFHKTLSSRGMIAALMEAKAKDGLPVVKLSGSASQGTNADGKAYFVDSKSWSKSDVSVDGRPYQSLDHSALKGWKLAFKDEAGNPIIVNGDMMIHPDHYAYLKNELGQSALREVPIISGLMKSQAFLKASKLSASFFHLATIGEHMASHLVNPFLNGFKIDLRNADQSLLVRNGLELGMSYPQMAYEEGLASAHTGLFNKIPGLGDASARITDWMFKDYIPAIMMKTGLHALENNRARYGDKLTPDQVAELTANQMNAAGGLMNYRLRGADGNMWGRLGANKTWMDLQRMALLAPQFLEARARVVGQALKPYGHEQRKMLIIQAGLLFIGARVLNQLLDGDPHWDNNPFSVVYKGRAYSIRSIVGDFWHALTDPKSFAAGRLSPFSRIGIESVTGRDLRTGARKEPPIQTEWVPGRVAQNVVVDLANWMTPITVEGMLPGAAGREQTLGSMALSSVGIGSRKFTAGMEIHDLARDFNLSSDDPATRNAQNRKDAGAYAQSPYRKLDALLDAGELDKAGQEIKSLQAEGKTLDQIANRYERNFYYTGSAAREQSFYSKLTDKQKELYRKAKHERAERAATLGRVIRQ